MSRCWQLMLLSFEIKLISSKALFLGLMIRWILSKQDLIQDLFVHCKSKTRQSKPGTSAVTWASPDASIPTKPNPFKDAIASKLLDLWFWTLKIAITEGKIKLVMPIVWKSMKYFKMFPLRQLQVARGLVNLKKPTQRRNFYIERQDLHWGLKFSGWHCQS